VKAQAIFDRRTLADVFKRRWFCGVVDDDGCTPDSPHGDGVCEHRWEASLTDAEFHARKML